MSFPRVLNTPPEKRLVINLCDDNGDGLSPPPEKRFCVDPKKDDQPNDHEDVRDLLLELLEGMDDTNAVVPKDVYVPAPPSASSWAPFVAPPIKPSTSYTEAELEAMIE